MKITISRKLLYRSAKKSFKLLRASGPYSCTALGAKVYVSKMFFDHIAHSRKRGKNLTDLAERLLILPFIDEIIADGEIVEKRKTNHIKYYRLSKKYEKQTYSIIITCKDGMLYLLSCFIDRL